MAGPLFFHFFHMRVYYGKLGHMLKHLASKCCPDLFTRLRDVVEKQVPEKLKPIVGGRALVFPNVAARYTDVCQTQASFHPCDCQCYVVVLVLCVCGGGVIEKKLRS